MGVLIYSEVANIHVGLSPVLINGIHEHYRDYKAQGHFIYIENTNHDLVYHDAKQLTAMKGFRLAEPEEQNEYFHPKHQQVLHEEEEPVAEEVHGETKRRKRG